MKIIILASGRGSNAENIIKLCSNNEIENTEVYALISDKEDAKALEIAKNLGIKSEFIDTCKKGAFFAEEGIKNYLEIFEKYNPDLIVLAGFMKILPIEITNLYANKIINLHPSLLPAFKGKDAIGQAWAYKVKVAGCSIHYVNEQLDGGSIIDQEAVFIEEDDTLESFTNKVHEAEYKLFPRVLNKLSKTLK